MCPASRPPEAARRGAAGNPHNRFERIAVAADPEFAEHVRHARAAAGPPPPGAGARRGEDGLRPGSDLEWVDPEPDPESDPRTEFFDDPSRAILSFNESPDVPFSVSMNPYRGCEHGCIYCYARPGHEYLGFSAGLDFETRILVKRDAPGLLRAALSKPSWTPQVVAIGGVTDPYQPAERRFELTRRCLEVFAELRNPTSIVTKSALVARDLDLLGELARFDASAVFVSITTLDRDLQRRMEPRAATPERRLATVEAVARAGVPVGVLVAPVIPGLTEHEIPAIVEAAARAGAQGVRHLALRLPHGVKSLFEDWLERHFPERRQKVLSRVRAMRGGRLNDPRFHERMRGSGPFAEQMGELLALACRRAGLSNCGPVLSTAAFRRPGGAQLALFDG